MENFHDELQQLIRTIAKENNIEHFTIEVRNTVSKEGDGYIGILKALYVRDKDSERVLNLVLKYASASENFRKKFPVRQAFLREMFLYEEIFPEFLQFQKKYNIPNPFTAVTKIYGSIKTELKETIIVGNLKENGYKMCNRKEPMDAQHLSLAVTEYAKFHAISFAMKELQPEKFKALTQNLKHGVIQDLQNDTVGVREKFLSGFFVGVLEILKDKPKELEAVKKFLSLTLTTLFSDMFLTDETYKVILHSDCWSTNMLFKYEDNGQPQLPTKLCLIDWQMSCLGHPVYDISYFLYICAGKKDLHNYKRYLNLYHTTLSETLMNFGLDPNEIYPYDLFEEHWKAYSKIGYFMTVIMLGQSLSDKKTHDFEKMADEGQDIYDSNLRPVDTSEPFRTRMGDLVEFLVENNFL